jgi:hypothetical protein
MIRRVLFEKWILFYINYLQMSGISILKHGVSTHEDSAPSFLRAMFVAFLSPTRAAYDVLETFYLWLLVWSPTTRAAGTSSG